MPLRLITPPVYDAALLADAKTHLRVDSIDDDALITSQIAAAIGYAEAFTRRAYYAQTWELVLESFPAGLASIDLLPPVQTVESISYVDTDGATQVWPGESYEVDTVSSRIIPAYGECYPSVRSQWDAVIVRFVTGHATLPEGVRAAVMLIVGDLYMNREAQQEINLYENRAVSSLLWPFRCF